MPQTKLKHKQQIVLILFWQLGIRSLMKRLKGNITLQYRKVHPNIFGKRKLLDKYTMLFFFLSYRFESLIIFLNLNAKLFNKVMKGF